jgi:hypothetical protein
MALALRDAARKAELGEHTTVAAAGAEALGLTADDRGFAGHTDPELELELTGASEGRLAGERIIVTARLLRPIATAFEIRTRRAGSRTDVDVSTDFDQRFSVKTYRDERVLRLLKTRLAFELVMADAAGFSVDLDRERVSVTGRWVTQIGEVTKIADTATRLAKALLAAERAQPELVPWAEVVRAWDGASERVGARFDREARVLVIESPFGSLRARPSTEREERWFGELSLRLEPALPVAFSLSDERGRSLWQRFTDREVLLGDRELDRAFVVETEDPEALLGLLGPDLKRALLELERRTGTLSVSARGFEARFDGASVTNEAALGEVLAAALGAAEALARAGVARARGAYR